MNEFRDEESAVDRKLLREQQHTLRERLSVVERRLHDLEVAQHQGAVRADVHADSIAEIRATLARIVAELEELGTP